MQTCHIAVGFDAFLGVDHGFFVPTKLEGGLNESYEHIQPHLLHSMILLIVKPKTLLVVEAVIPDEVSSGFIDFESLFVLFVLIERVSFLFELFSVGQLVIGQVDSQVSRHDTIWELILRNCLSQNVIVCNR